MPIMIAVNQLGKRYTLSGTPEPYSTLRDSITRFAKNSCRRLLRRPTGHRRSQEFWALRDVEFKVDAGDCVGIIGRNGAGKSTLLKVLSRITEPTLGEIRLKGRVGSLLEVGTGFHPELTGRENIFLNGAILGMRRKDISRKFDDIVGFAEVSKFLDTAVKYYSSGMYTRLAFAVAAHLEPDILIIDEVLAVGDVEFQQKCLGKMNDVAKEGRTVLFVSHNMQAVTTLCSRALVLKRGQLIDDGPATACVSKYLAESSNAACSEWTGQEGDRSAVLLRTAIKAADREAILRTDRAIVVEVSVRLLAPIIGLVCAIEIFNQSGTRLVYTNFDDAESPPSVEMRPGDYHLELTIPPHIFAAGLYDFVFDLGIHNLRRIVTGAGSLRVRIENIEGIGRRTLAHENVIRPKWEWQITRTEEGACA